MADALKRQRAACKGGLTKILKFANEINDASRISDIQSRMGYTKDLMNRFCAIESQLLTFEGERTEISEFEDDYLTAISKFTAALEKRCSSHAPVVNQDETLNHTIHPPINVVKYAKVNIPTFFGDSTEFQSFIDLFNAAVHNVESYSNSQKFQLLKRYLDGEAASLVRHLAITDANYEEAITRLKERYDRKKTIITAFIRKFMTIPRVSKISAASIRCCQDTADEVLRGLRALGDMAETRDWWLIYILVDKLDDETKTLWAQETVASEKPTITDLFKFLDKRVDSLEAVQSCNKPSFNNQSKRQSHLAKATSLTTHANAIEKNPPTCQLCLEPSHRLIECKRYNSMNVKQRQDYIKSQNRCFNCLNFGHRLTTCNYRARCAICHQKHHKTLHSDEPKPTTSQSLEVNQVVSTLMQSQPTLPSFNVAAVLPTANVMVKDREGNLREFRALLDSGSQASFVTESCSQKLGLKRVNSRMVITGIGSSSAGKSRGMITLCLKPGFPSTYEISVNALIIPKITTQLPKLLADQHLQWISSIQLADPVWCKNRNIDILLGADVFFEVLDEGQLKSPTSHLLAQNTKLGWVIGGSTMSNNDQLSSHCTMLDIDATLRQFWEVEDVSKPNHSEFTTEEQACIKYYRETTTQAKDGKFTTRLPFKLSPLSLPGNYHSALSQLLRMERRFQRDSKLEQLYREFMQEYIQLGHMNKVEVPINEAAYYMPHHGVLKETSSTTKLRVVFNASARIGQNPSLNTFLMVGPTVQSSLWAILLRFRLYRYVFTADIEKMYRQIWVHEDDQPYQQILWRDEKNNVCAYKLNTVTYGTSSAPFVATFTVHELASSFLTSHHNAAKSLQNDVYVDDVLKGATTLEELRSLKEDMCQILKSGGFNLRKFESNHSSLRDLSCVAESKSFNEHNDTVKVLGIQWNPTTDTFTFHTSLPFRENHTKRSVLSEASRIFDPYGWLSPVLIKSKMLMQELWRQNLDWDDKLFDVILNKWLTLRREIENCTSITINRWFGCTFDVNEEIQIHGFSDASEKAYSAVVYFRVISKNGIKCRLICSKTKVSPIKPVTLPRLELLGAELLSSHVQAVLSQFTVNPSKVVLWTDSKIVLDWLSSEPRRWATFVANRVGKITSVFGRSQWRHIPSELNPADCASRGISLTELQNHELWWTGPSFLEQPEDYWPKKVDTIISNALEERKMKVTSHAAQLNPHENTTINYIINKFSSYNKILRILSYMLRIISPDKPKLLNLNVEDINHAEEILCREVQKQDFPEDYTSLSTCKSLTGKSKLIQLNPFLDNSKVMRVGGRISHSLASYTTKHPIILSGKSLLCQRISWQLHLDNCHPGPTLMLSMLQEKFHVTGARKLVKHIFQHCVRCIKQHPRAENQLMGDLPKERVIFDAPFSSVGVDFAGPFKVHTIRKRGSNPEHKSYLCVFVCLATRAIHLELCLQLTTQSFIAALKRFTGRRGLCNTILCDNGLNFVGAASFLKEIQQFFEDNSNTIASSMLRERITFKFNPPSAPHMGGVWEAAVKSAKTQLRRCIGDEILTLEEFSTLLVQIESALNARPICALNSEDELALTPAHFLIHRPAQQVPDIVDESQLTLHDRWDIVRRITINFWNRWQREYLVTLQNRSKWYHKSDNLKEDDVVVILEQNLLPGKWLLGRVIAVYPDKLGNVRIVKLKTATGSHLDRPITKLCKLPVNESTDSWPARC